MSPTADSGAGLASTTVAELAALVTRQAQALCEAGRPDLAELCHVVVQRDGTVQVSFRAPADGVASPEIMKAISIDLLFEHATSPDDGYRS